MYENTLLTWVARHIPTTLASAHSAIETFPVALDRRVFEHR